MGGVAIAGTGLNSSWAHAIEAVYVDSGLRRHLSIGPGTPGGRSLVEIY
jgi:hypothetical protein